MALCYLCHDALSGRVPEPGGTTLIHTNFRKFLAAVDEGCHVCQWLFCQAPEEWRQEARKSVEISESSVEEQSKANDSRKGLTEHIWLAVDHSRYCCISLDLRRIDWISDAWWNNPETLESPWVFLFLYPVVAEPLLWTFTSLTTNSDETFTKIKAWLGKCGSTHDICRLRKDHTEVGWQPTRLVEIASEPRSGENADNMRCRVVEPKSESIPQDLKYITLSHRWPQDLRGFQKLTLDNLPLWKDSLPVAILSQTFRDTFLVAQKLGISYVWIDSLCIIQDGNESADWEKEAPMMHKVYSNAEFNICASKTDQGEQFGGLFSSREPSSHQSVKIQFSKADGDDSCHDSGHYLILEDVDRRYGVWDPELEYSPLASRGWVFQERLLSRANTHFGDQEVFFECPEMTASEYMGSEQDYEVSLPRFDHIVFKKLLPIHAVVEEGPVVSRKSSGSDYDYDKLGNYNEYEHWHALLSRYTSLQLTNSDDRLVALSGVAKYFKAFFPHDDYYIAGLWHGRLATEMLWQVYMGSSRGNWENRNKSRRHLTFSWVSVPGTVVNHAVPKLYSSFVTKPLAEIKPMKYRLSSEPRVATGGEGQPFAEDIFSLPTTPMVEIRLMGLLRPMTLVPTDSSTQGQVPPETPLGSLGGFMVLDLWGKHQSLHLQVTLDFELGLSELTALNKSCRLYCMPLLGEEGYSTWLLLLEVLETSDGKDMGRFRRVGVHRHQHFAPLSEWTAVNAPFKDSFSKLPCWSYDDHSKQHTIFVV